MAAATTLGLVAAFGGCAALAATDDGCGFDPPPGDVGRVHVVNDEREPVNLFDCSDATCDSGENLQHVPTGHSQWANYELCSGTSIGLTDSHGTLVGCLALPIGETVSEPTYRATRFDRTCAGDGGIHPRIG